MRRFISNIIRSLLFFMLISSAAMCIFWLPNAVEYASGVFKNAESFKNAEYLLYTIGYIIALPLFIVFIIAFKFPTAIEADTIFHEKTAKLIKFFLSFPGEACYKGGSKGNIGKLCANALNKSCKAFTVASSVHSL